MKLLIPFPLAAFLILATLLAAGCSGKTEDVRFKLCREVTGRILESMGPITWKGQASEIRRAGDAATRLEFSVGAAGHENRRMTSACLFERNRPEDSALDHVDPLAAYSTLPYGMTVNEEPVPGDILRQAVTAEQLEGISEFVAKVKRKIGTLPVAK